MELPQDKNRFDELWDMLGEVVNDKPSGIEEPELETGEITEEPVLSSDDSNETTKKHLIRRGNKIHHPETEKATGQPSSEISSKTIKAEPDIELSEPENREEERNIELIPLDKRGKKCLSDIRKYASWQGEDGERGLQAAIDLFKAEYPGHADLIDDAVAEGKKDKALLSEVETIKTEEAFQNFIRDNEIDPNSYLYNRLIKQYQYFMVRSKKTNQEINRKKSGQPLSNIKGPSFVSPSRFPKKPISSRPTGQSNTSALLHTNDIRSLKPSSAWQLLIDETGAVFDNKGLQASGKKQKKGKFIGILVPAGKKLLKPLPSNWHAADKGLDEIDRVFQSILDAPVGVFGFEVASVPVTPGERWMDGVALLIEWILRLLPVDNKTHVDVLVENRGLFKAGQTWDVVRRDCLRRLALAYPKRALNIDFEIRVINKGGSPLLGYVDALAFSWARTSNASKERLKKSQMVGSCLLDQSAGVDARTMLHAWDAFAQGVHLPPPVWWDMLGAPDSSNPAALISSFLNLIGEEARADQALWGSLLAEVKKRMADSPVELMRLASAVDWLQKYKPADAEILPAMRLVWLTVQLARANHLGEKEGKWETELKEIENRLFDEAAPLVCHSHLHRAVAATNRFDFAGARQVVEFWEQHPPAVPGLLYWAQVKSSLGQHAAFLGDNAKAIALFNEALSGFARLSDPEARRVNELQTACYLAISMMDEPGCSHADVRAAVERVTGRLPDAAIKLATSHDPADRYAHHLLLRWLAYRTDEQVLQAYLNCQNRWNSGTGHPWQLIELYRAILLYPHNPDEARKFAIQAGNISFEADQGPTVRFIGACCRVVASYWGEAWNEAEDQFNRLETELPFASDRIARLRAAISDPQDPLKLFADVLPFNFR